MGRVHAPCLRTLAHADGGPTHKARAELDQDDIGGVVSDKSSNPTAVRCLKEHGRQSRPVCVTPHSAVVPANRRHWVPLDKVPLEGGGAPGLALDQRTPPTGWPQHRTTTVVTAGCRAVALPCLSKKNEMPTVRATTGGCASAWWMATLLPPRPRGEFSERAGALLAGRLQRAQLVCLNTQV